MYVYDIICENCKLPCQKKRSDGRPPRFCSRDCWSAYTRSAPRQWRSAGYWTRHTRVVQVRGPAKEQTCAHCPNQARDWATEHGRSGFDPSDYLPLCRSCHLRYDGTVMPPVMPGETNPAAKITWDMVREIRSSPDTAADLARRYHLNPETVRRVRRGQTWKEP